MHNLKSIQKRDLPIWIMFCIFPFISIYAWAAGLGEVNYDYVWVIVFVLLFICKFFGKNSGLKKKNFQLIIILSFLFALKYLVPWLYTTQISLTASVMDGKWVAYLMLAILWIDTFGYPSIEKMYKAGLFFSIIYIGKALYVIATGQLSRSGVLLEANYDGFMILIVYCCRGQISNKKKWEHWVLILATFLTLSRTGILSLFALWFVKMIKKNVLMLIPTIPIMLGMVYLGFSMRGAESAGHFDRFVYWKQAFIYFRQADWSEVILGSTPGKSLRMTILPEFDWTVSMFEEVRNLNGVFPFMFHSTYLRLAFTWGVPLAIFFALYFILKYIKSANEQVKQLCILVLIQSFSLSSLTLPNVSLLLFMVLITVSHQNRVMKMTSKYR